MWEYDFLIPEEYRGKTVELPPHPRGLMTGEKPDPKIILAIPKGAHFLHIQPFDEPPLEDGEEDGYDHNGCADLTTRQRLGYYSANCKCISSEFLEGVEQTDLLMGRLETILIKQY